MNSRIQVQGSRTMSGVAETVVGPVATPVTPARRVRHDVRDGLAVMAFSAATSIGLTVVLMLLTRLGK
jgi:hypothetical protein